MDVQIIDARTKQEIIDARMKCLFCHKETLLSTKTEDVLLPGIQLCRDCHRDAGGAQAECKTCHVFHRKTITRFSDSHGHKTFSTVDWNYSLRSVESN